MERVELFTPEKCLETVKQWDKNHTQGMGARYNPE
jgi:hypothetical protein